MREALPTGVDGETRGDEAPVVIDQGESQYPLARGRRVIDVVDERRRRLRARVETRPTYKWWVLFSVLSGLFATGLTITVLTAALPFIRDEFGASTASVSWVVAAPFLLRAVFVPAFGKVGDLWGRKRTWVWGFALSTLFSFVAGFAPNIGFLIGARVLSAVAGAAVAPSSMALIAEAFEPEERVKALGWWSATIAISPLAGVVAGGFLIDAFSWRWLFYGQFPFGVAALVLGVVVLRDSRSPERQRFDLAGAALSIVALAALMIVFNQGVERGWTSPVIMASAVLGVLTLAAFVVVELRSPHPVLPVHYFRSRRFTAALTLNYFAQFLYMGGFFITSLMMRDVFLYSAVGVSLAVAPRAASLGVMGPLAGNLTSKIGGKTLAVLGMTFIVVSSFVLAGIGPESSYVMEILPGLVLAGFGLGLVTPQAAATVTNESAPGDLASASGALNMFVAVGQSMGIAIMQALVTAHADGTTAVAADYSYSFRLAGIICAVGIVAGFFIPMWPGRSEAKRPEGEAQAPPTAAR